MDTHIKIVLYIDQIFIFYLIINLTSTQIIFCYLCINNKLVKVLRAQRSFDYAFDSTSLKMEVIDTSLM